MSQIEVERFLGRMITDQNFRIKVTESLENATDAEGIVLSNAEKAILGGIDFSQLTKASKCIDGAIKRS